MGKSVKLMTANPEHTSGNKHGYQYDGGDGVSDAVALLLHFSVL
jgi:hypothetical protein